METKDVAKCFCEFIRNGWPTANQKPFLFARIKLLQLFKKDLSAEVASALEERLKQLAGEDFVGNEFDEIKMCSASKMDFYLANGLDDTKEGWVNRFVFGAFIDKNETDLYYHLASIFEFCETMNVSSFELLDILKSEFHGFSMDHGSEK